MRVVIQCAATKDQNAGTLRTPDGRQVAFVADPALARPEPGVLHAHPDDDVPDQPGLTWRGRVAAENAPDGSNPWGLLPAGELYRPRIYRALTARFGVEQVFILSAGWGLVRSDWRLPAYDIAFGASAAPHHRRRGIASYQDWVASSLWDLPEPDLIFLGGQAYLRLFQHLTACYGGRRLVFYPQLGPDSVAPDLPGCATQAFVTTQRTNWHYACAAALVEDKVSVALRPLAAERFRPDLPSPSTTA